MVNDLIDYITRKDLGDDVFEEIYNQKMLLDKYKFLLAYDNFKKTLINQCGLINDNNYYVKIGVDDLTDASILKSYVLYKDGSNGYTQINSNASLQLIATASTLSAKANYLYTTKNQPYFNQTGKTILFNLSSKSDIDKLDKFILDKSILPLYNAAILEMNLPKIEQNSGNTPKKIKL